ncbi:MAG: helix-turn-helix domain-containing protein, partial [Oscillospiraceae bacterium]|nr:helix-turn-helix domain-containing protein [Oscillospiraceae bacterium]
VQKILRIGRNKTYALFRTGDLKGFKIGREWKTTRKALDDYIKSLNKDEVV